MYDGPIIDAHIHLWDPRTTPRTASPLVRGLGWNERLLRRAAQRLVPDASLAFVGRPDQVLNPYLPGTWWNETDGADVRGFVHVQADWQSKTAMGQVEETRWLESVCGRDLLALVGNADLADPRLDAVLDAHCEASGRFRGIRDYLAHGGDDEGLASFADSPDRLAQHAWRRGFDRLGARGLTFDAWAYGHQLDDVAELVADHPGTPVVLCHAGSPVGVGGPFAAAGRTESDRQAVLDRWRDDLAAVAAHDHVHVKLSGLAMPISGWGWHERVTPPGVEEVADALGPLVEHVLATFGPSRTMAASNFPMDRVSLRWTTWFDALDRLTASHPEHDRRAIFHDTAATFYRIDQPAPDPTRTTPPGGES
ncbi:amidohydrolase [Euzebya sp.]|uniref:amidohydrolase family protein n=1 Tax=Euzebya sp. TaxID=1971409 RepID=UPI003518437F